MYTDQDTVIDIRSNPIEWLETCGVILNRAGQLVTPVANTFQQRVNDIYLWCREQQIQCRIIILKPRRKGSSTISLSLMYTHLRNYVNYGAILGDDLGTTAKLLEVWKRFAEKDKFIGPSGRALWGNSVSRDQMSFSHGSTLYEETANDPRAGMGGDIHFLLASEAAHYRRKGKASGEVVMMSIMNSVPALPNTCVIMESTPNGAQGVFYDTWQKAVDFSEFKKGNRGNGYIKVFAPWFEFDDSKLRGLTDEGREHIMRTLDEEPKYAGETGDEEHELIDKFHVSVDCLAWRRMMIDDPACGGDPRKFQQEYPKDPITCFLRSGSARFDHEGISVLDRAIELNADGTRPKYGILEYPDGAAVPVFTETDKLQAWMVMFEPPKPGLRYIGAADWMTGEQASGARRETDCHAYGIGRARYTDSELTDHNAKVVACCLEDDRTKDLDICAERLSMMAKFYGNCLIAPEVNNFMGMIELLKKYRVGLWSRKKQGAGKSVTIPGFQTTPSSKRQIIGELAALIREQELDIFLSRALLELRNFITWPDGKEAAGDGYHDDWVMFLAILAHVLPAANVFQTREDLDAREARRRSFYASQGRRSGASVECS